MLNISLALKGRDGMGRSEQMLNKLSLSEGVKD